MKVIDAVVRFDLGFDPTLTHRSIQFVEKFGKPMRVGELEHNRLDENVRKVNGVSVYPQNMETPEDISKYAIYKFISHHINKYIMMYASKFPFFMNSHSNPYVNQIDILKYFENGKYTAHVDDGPDSNRSVTVILNLNDEYEGGDFLFFDPTKKTEIIRREKLKKGSLLFFPSNFLYGHSVEPITKGTRYSIVSWIA